MRSKFMLLILITAVSGALCGFSAPAFAGKIRVVTTLTDLADFAREIGGDRVDVKSLATGVEDTHGIPMKPSFVPLLNRADMIILVGMDCEHAFLPALLEASKNPSIQKGRIGYVDCSAGIVPRDVPKSTDHYQGDVHPEGNPHYMLDPVLAKTAVENIYNAFVTFAPQYRALFTRNRDAYLQRLNARIAEWENEARPLRGVKFVSYHEHWPYFAARFGMDYFDTIELKPGIDPTPRHIENLCREMIARHVGIVVREQQFSERVPRRIADETHATLITLPIMPNAMPGTETYIKMMDYIVRTMVAAARAPK
jgi:zinc/manganese transport system substrate-binding protein